jgi:hypothetical protein
MSKVNNGIDMIARDVGDMVGASYYTGTSTTAPTATTFPMDGATMPSASSGGPPHNTGALVGRVVVRANRYAIILQHSATAATGLTVDRWYDPTNPGAAAGSTPAAGQWVIAPGGAPAAQLGLSVATRAIAAADPFLTNDGTTVSEIWNSGGGLNRALGSYAHTVGTATYTLSKTWTTTGSDPASSTVHRVGVFVHAVDAAPSTTTTGIMVYETNLSADAIMTNNGSDQLTVTETVTIS